MMFEELKISKEPTQEPTGLTCFLKSEDHVKLSYTIK